MSPYPVPSGRQSLPHREPGRLALAPRPIALTGQPRFAIPLYEPIIYDRFWLLADVR